MEAAGGVVLVVAAALALWTANSPLASGDADLLHLELRLGVGRFSSTENLQHWVNDGRMAIFFFIGGLRSSASW
jgi:NhaA family Na+:H+ antiporter